MYCFALTRRLSLWILFVIGIPVFFPALAAATSASISISGQEGAIPLSASATFTKYKFCNGASPPDCWYDNSGTLAVRQKHPNGSVYYLGGNSGKGSAEWSTTLDTGAMAQGTHTFVVTACDVKGNCSSDSRSITIDNTPVVTASVNNTEGDLNIKGTVDFKEYVGGNEGSVTIYYIHPNGSRYYVRSKSYEGAAPLEWTWKDIAGSIPDAGAWAQGKYTVQIIATAANGVAKQIDLPITIDNTPVVTASVNNTEGDLNIKGTVDFKEYVGGNEGSVTIYYIHPNGSRYYVRSKSYEGAAPLEWTWKDIAGSIPDAGAWAQGKYTVQIIATAANGVAKQIDLPITIDNTPVVTASVNNTEGDLNIKGTVDFKEYVGGNEGSVTIYYIHPNGSRYYVRSKSYEGAAPLEWTWKDIAGSIPDAGAWAQGKYTVQIIATAANGVAKQIDLPITIDNTPVVTASVNNTEGDLNIKGTVDFKEYVGGNEGSVTIYYIHPNGSRYYVRSKSYEGAAPLEWTWKDIAGSIPDAGAWAQGKYTVQIIATAANGVAKQIDLPIIIDNTPVVTASVNNTEGDLNIKGTVDFKEYVGGNEGSVTIYYIHPNGSRYYVRSKSYEGVAPLEWTWKDIAGSIPDAGAWAQGKYTVQIIATAANGVAKQIDLPITIDNTPVVTASVNNTEGDLNIKGTVDFKEYVGGNEGSVTIYYIHPNGSRYYVRSKSYEGAAPLEWTWKDIAGSIPDAGAWAQGKYTVQIIATAANGVAKQFDLPIAIDNTPKVQILGPRCYADLTCDILGTVQFKEYVGGSEGSVTLALKDVSASSYSSYGSKSYEGTSINWKYADFAGARMSKATWGGKELMVQVVARAANGATATSWQYLMIPALGCPIPLR